MSLRYSDINYNYAIQKVARDVINGMTSGKNPMELLIKAAQAEKMTPQLVESAVHYLNNELMLKHFEKKAQDKFQFINVKDVLDALSVKDGEKTASAQVVNSQDYWNLRKNNINKFEKIADYMVEDVAYENRKKSFEKLASFEKIANEKKQETKKFDNIVKKASDIRKMKEQIYNDTFLMLKRADIDAEEIKVLAEISQDNDLKQVYSLALENSKVKVAQDKYKEVLNKLATDGPDYNSPIIKTMTNFLKLKKEIL